MLDTETILKVVAQRLGIPRRHLMPDHLVVCLVCGSPEIDIYHDRSEGVTMEYQEDCKRCGLYHYEMITGNSREYIGFVCTDNYWAWEELSGSRSSMIEVRKESIRQARGMYRSEALRPMLEAVRQAPDDLAPKLILADQLQERGLYPLQEEALRKMCEKPHELYMTGDADAPECIKDRDGHVVLDLCRKCNRGESELDGGCR